MTPRCAHWPERERARRLHEHRVAALEALGQDELLDREEARPRRRSRSAASGPGAACCCWRGAPIARRAFDAGELPGFLPETQAVRGGDWQVAPAPADLQNRHVEITGPVERKMMINALNSGAQVFMADFEDSLSPSWRNVIDGQQNCIDAVRKNISFTSPEGKSYRLNDSVATLLVRPRAAGTSPTSTSPSTASPSAPASSTSGSSSSTTPPSCCGAAAAPTSTCRRWRATSRRACGTRSSSPPRRRWRSRAARCARRC